eukprot:TRINITY_DN762_c0_g2_i1.p1 TRINITY_DN762_c0_g2~~TRINITY_DN762_c0_g2_i1.p1  ORF type:complete len:404 (-),score=126.88 TRINITY_DN762_c0_g2_i1:433-1644(-)
MDFCLKSEDPGYYFDSLASLPYSSLHSNSWDLLDSMGSSMDWENSHSDYFLYDKSNSNMIQRGQKRKREQFTDPGLQFSKKLKTPSGSIAAAVHLDSPSSPEFYSNASSPSSSDYFDSYPDPSPASYSPPINESDFNPHPIIPSIPHSSNPNSNSNSDHSATATANSSPSTTTTLPIESKSRSKTPKIGDEFQTSLPQQLLTEAEKAKYRKERSAGELVWQPDAIPQDQTTVYLQKLRNLASQSGDFLDEEKALTILHNCNYKLTEAIKQISQTKNPLTNKYSCSIIKKGSWTPLEAKLFETGYSKYGKEFKKIQTDFLDKRSVGDIVQYFMLWKTSERYEFWYRNEMQKTQAKIAQQYVKVGGNSLQEEEEEEEEEDEEGREGEEREEEDEGEEEEGDESRI